MEFLPFLQDFVPSRVRSPNEGNATFKISHNQFFFTPPIQSPSLDGTSFICHPWEGDSMREIENFKVKVYDPQRLMPSTIYSYIIQARKFKSPLDPSSLSLRIKVDDSKNCLIVPRFPTFLSPSNHPNMTQCKIRVNLGCTKFNYIFLYV